MKLLCFKWKLFTMLILRTQGIFSQDSISGSINKAITVAFYQNSNIINANDALIVSKFALKEAKANFLPKLYLSSSSNRNVDRQVIFLSEDFGTTNSYTILGFDNEFRRSLNLPFPIYEHYNSANMKQPAKTNGIDYWFEMKLTSIGKIIPN